MKAEKKFAEKLEGPKGFMTINPMKDVACNVEECYFENYGDCLAGKIIITNEGCMTDRNLVED